MKKEEKRTEGAISPLIMILKDTFFSNSHLFFNVEDEKNWRKTVRVLLRNS